MSKKKKVTVEDARKAFCKDGSTDQSLSIFPDDKYNSILPITLGLAASRAYWGPESEAKKRKPKASKGLEAQL